MRISKKIENELWMMVQWNDKPSIKEKTKFYDEDKTHVIGCQSRVISWLQKFVDPKKIN